MKHREKCRVLANEFKEYNRRGCDFGNVKIRSGSWLYEQVLKCRSKSIVVEVGTLKGRSTFWLDRGAAKRNASVYTIDTWFGTSDDAHYNKVDEFRMRGGYKKIFLRNKEIARMDHTHSVCGYSWEIGEMFRRKSIDFVYVDGDHNNVMRDVITFFPKLRDDCVLSGHDWAAAPKYQYGWPTVNVALTAVFGNRVDSEIGDEVWAVVKGKREIELFDYFMKNTVLPLEEKLEMPFNEIDVLDYIDDINVIVPHSVLKRNIK